MADENKNEYAAQLQNFNGEQHKHYYIVIPQIYKVKKLTEKYFWSFSKKEIDFKIKKSIF